MREAMTSNSATRRASIELADNIQSAKEAAARLNKRVGRFEIYSFLKPIYRSTCAGRIARSRDGRPGHLPRS